MISYTKLVADLDSGVYFSQLHNNPRPHSRRRTPTLVLQDGTDANATHTVVMPVFNHAGSLPITLALLQKSIALPHSLIVIDDGSEDNSSETIVKYFNEHRSPQLRGIMVLRNEVPIFETASDNLGFYLAETPFVIEVQADLRIEEPGFDAAMIEVLNNFPSATSCSGRCGHAFGSPPNFWPWDRTRYASRLEASRVGLYDSSIERPEISDPLRGFVYRTETVNRGPWALRRGDLQACGFLDEANFFLGDDDHDYHRRAYLANGASPLYLPMRVGSRLAEGATRRERSGINQSVWEELRSSRKGSDQHRHFLGSRKGRVTPVEAIRWNPSTPARPSA